VAAVKVRASATTPMRDAVRILAMQAMGIDAPNPDRHLEPWKATYYPMRAMLGEAVDAQAFHDCLLGLMACDKLDPNQAAELITPLRDYLNQVIGQ
jgi:hypothetical protein